MKRWLSLTGIVVLAVCGALQAQDYYVPGSVSEAAQKALREMKKHGKMPPFPAPGDLEGWKAAWEKREDSAKAENEAIVKTFEPVITAARLGGIAVLDIRPKGWVDNHRVLVYVHGGGYTFYSAASSMIDTVPVAQETGLRIISVDYTRAPFAKFMKVTGEIVAVVRALQQQGYKSGNIALYGDSAGGSLATGSVLRMRDEGIALPGALVLWSPWSDITDIGDTYHTLQGDDPYLTYEALKPRADVYADPKDQKHPYVSPVYGDYSRGFPPTLIQGGTKEIFLSNFIRQYQAIDTAGQVAKLDLYEGMWHVFQEWYDMPEAKTALKKMKLFLEQYLDFKS